MKQQIVVIGLGRFGATVAATLAGHGHEVLGIDVDRARVDGLSDEITHAVQANVTNEETLRDLGVSDFGVGIVAIATAIEASVMATLLLKRLGVPHVIARASNLLHADLLLRIGADRVVFPERELGVQVAHTFGAPHIEDYLEVAPDYGLSRLRLPSAFVGRTLAELDLPTRYGLTAVLVRRGDEVLLGPPATERLNADDHIVVAGTVEALAKLGAALATQRPRGG